MITNDLQPVSILEDKGFLHLMKVAAPRFHMPSRSHMVANLKARHLSQTSKLRTVLSSVDFVSLTSDSWTSRTTDNYTTVTSHYIDDKWNVQACVLETRFSAESHTGAYLTDFFKQVVSDWNINSKSRAQVVITTDNAANVTNGVSGAGYLNIGLV